MSEKTTTAERNKATPSKRYLKSKEEPARRRGRPKKQPDDEQIFAMTLRLPRSYRKALRRVAESETDERGQVVSVHSVILEMVEANMRSRGQPL